MTKTKNGHKGHGDRVNPSDVASTESSSTMAITEVHGHEAECHPCLEHAIDEFDMAIRELAYHKWEAAGFPAGDGIDFWLEAEREVNANQPASTTAPE